MTWLDLVIIGIVILSSVIGVVRGFVKEALSLAGWVVSFIIAWRFHSGMVSLLDSFISNKNMQYLTGFVILFILSMLIFAMLTFFAGKLVQRTGLTGTDRAIGVIFGFLRGLVLVVALTALAGLTTAPRAEVWKNSLLTYHVQSVAMWLTRFLPDDIEKNFIFN